jgi:hypothetical protein
VGAAAPRRGINFEEDTSSKFRRERACPGDRVIFAQPDRFPCWVVDGDAACGTRWANLRIPSPDMFPEGALVAGGPASTRAGALGPAQEMARGGPGIPATCARRCPMNYPRLATGQGDDGAGRARATSIGTGDLEKLPRRPSGRPQGHSCSATSRCRRLLCARCHALSSLAGSRLSCRGARLRPVRSATMGRRGRMDARPRGQETEFVPADEPYALTQMTSVTSNFAFVGLAMKIYSVLAGRWRDRTARPSVADRDYVVVGRAPRRQMLEARLQAGRPRISRCFLHPRRRRRTLARTERKTARGYHGFDVSRRARRDPGAGPGAPRPHHQRHREGRPDGASSTRSTAGGAT